MRGHNYDRFYNAGYRKGFLAAKRQIMRRIRERFYHLNTVDQLDLYKLIKTTRTKV